MKKFVYFLMFIPVFFAVTLVSESALSQKKPTGDLCIAECQKIADGWKKDKADMRVWYDRDHCEVVMKTLLGSWRLGQRARVLIFTQDIFTTVDVGGTAIPFYEFERLNGDVKGYAIVKSNWIDTSGREYMIIAEKDGSLSHVDIILGRERGGLFMAWPNMGQTLIKE